MESYATYKLCHTSMSRSFKFERGKMEKVHAKDFIVFYLT